MGAYGKKARVERTALYGGKVNVARKGGECLQIGRGGVPLGAVPERPSCRARKLVLGVWKGPGREPKKMG